MCCGTESLSVLQCTLCCVCVCVCVCTYMQANLTASCCLRFAHVCLVYVCMPRGTPVPQHGIIFWPVGVYTRACCEPLMAGSQEVTRSELLTHHRDPSLPQHLGELYLWHWQTWVLLSAIWFHCLFLYTSKLILCQFCCQQWQKGARTHSNGMAREDLGNLKKKKKKKKLKANCKVVFIVAVLVADTQVCLQSAPGRSRGPMMKMKQ